MESSGDLDVAMSEFFITGGSLVAASGGTTTGAHFFGQNVSPGGILIDEVFLSGHDVVGILLEGSVGVTVDGVTMEVSGPGSMEGIAIVHGISHVSPLITLTNATLTLSNYHLTANSSGEIYGMKIEAQTLISVAEVDFSVSGCELTALSGEVSGIAFVGGTGGLGLQEGSATVSGTVLKSGNATRGLVLTSNSVITFSFALNVTSTSLESSYADSKGIDVDVPTTITLDGAVSLNMALISSNGGDVVGVDVSAGGAISLLGSLEWSPTVEGLNATNGDAFLVRGISLADILVDVPIAMDNAVTVNVGASGDVYGLYFSSGATLTASERMELSNLRLESTSNSSGKVTGAELHAPDLVLLDAIWELASVSLSGNGDVDGFLMNATSTVSLSSFRFQIDNCSHSSSSGGLVRGVVWDFASDLSTDFAEVVVIESSFFSNGIVQAWVFDNDVAWTAADSSFILTDLVLEGSFVTHGVFLSLASLSTTAAVVEVADVTLNTLGNLDSSVFLIDCTQDIIITWGGDPTPTFTYKNVNAIFTDLSPASSALPLSWLSLHAGNSITLQGLIEVEDSSLTSHGNCEGFRIVADNAFSWTGEGGFGFTDSQITCQGNVTGVLVMAGAGGLSMTGVGGMVENQAMVKAEGNLHSAQGHVIGVFFMGDGGNIELEEVFFFFFFFFFSHSYVRFLSSFFFFFFFFVQMGFLNDGYYDSNASVTGAYLYAPGQLISYENTEDGIIEDEEGG